MGFEWVLEAEVLLGATKGGSSATGLGQKMTCDDERAMRVQCLGTRKGRMKEEEER